METTTTSAEDAATHQPVYWFMLLELAVESGDFESAAEAQRQLERLGVQVNYRRRREEAVDAASR
jgi:hypothetical protein